MYAHFIQVNGENRECQCESAAERVTMECRLAAKAQKSDSDEEDDTHKRLRNHIGHHQITK